MRDYVLAQDGAAEFLDRYEGLLRLVFDGYAREGKRYALAAVGCTGGKHRSVAMAEQLAGRLAGERRRRAPSSTATWAASDRRPAAAGAPPAPSPHGPKVVALGGGHGLAASLQALRQVTPDLTAVVTVADDGGSSGRLRAELGALPPGDLRMALAALAGDDEWGSDLDDAAAAPLRRRRPARRARGRQPRARRARPSAPVATRCEALDLAGAAASARSAGCCR